MARVTPLVGVWIEISNISQTLQTESVTPLVGVWIEITHRATTTQQCPVTPLVGVWIEMNFYKWAINHEYSHSPCGSVD